MENLDATRTGFAQLPSFFDEQFLMQLKTISANGHIAVAIKYDDGNDLYDFGFREGLAIYFEIDSTQLYALRNYFMRAMMR
ncbi:hypothetical protein [Spirosoma agri]|uniref:Uncharacterized protein n=1 Tax=Spirosoma agri TaxID=1987381 RepID=A0A6M0IN86_9BACT|nr:hypothetical protein [Spirosoma agri]NEU69786.1 hypothetical protein [Spirosoma agri]